MSLLTNDDEGCLIVFTFMMLDRIMSGPFIIKSIWAASNKTIFFRKKNKKIKR